MTCTDKQIGILMKHRHTNTQEVAAAKAGMTSKTAREYIRSGKLPSEQKQERDWRTRPDAFADKWAEIEALLKNAPALQAQTVLEWLITNEPDKYSISQVRTLRRRFKDWLALHGPGKDVIFPQVQIPGRQSQSDGTWMNDLHITINGEQFDHLLFHFMLPYSRWETVSICFSESFDSLQSGYEAAVWELVAVAAEHRTDNLSAATKRYGSSRAFTDNWSSLMKHYKVQPSRNNPGVSHENGSVEKSNDIFKKTVDQQLMLRGSRDFSTIDDYNAFLRMVLSLRNKCRTAALSEELRVLKALPDKKWNAPLVTQVRVTPDSTVSIKGGVYSVPSRLISNNVRAMIYATHIKIYYSTKLIQEMPRQDGKQHINYRHIVHSLIRKPGAFANYKYRDSLFPNVVFRKAYDLLLKRYPDTAHKRYLKILHLAAIESEAEVIAGLELMFDSELVPDVAVIKDLIGRDGGNQLPTVTIKAANTESYDVLLESQNKEVQHAAE